MNPFERASGRSAGFLEVIHQLRCLKYLRQTNIKEYHKSEFFSFQDESEVVRSHTDRIEMLRLAILYNHD